MSYPKSLKRAYAKNHSEQGTKAAAKKLSSFYPSQLGWKKMALYSGVAIGGIYLLRRFGVVSKTRELLRLAPQKDIQESKSLVTENSDVEADAKHSPLNSQERFAPLSH